MRIVFQNVDHLSLSGSFVWDDVPGLAIIAGKNGCGKTQLLNVLKTAYGSGAYGVTLEGTSISRKKDVVHILSDWQISSLSGRAIPNKKLYLSGHKQAQNNPNKITGEARQRQLQKVAERLRKEPHEVSPAELVEHYSPEAVWSYSPQLNNVASDVAFLCAEYHVQYVSKLGEGRRRDSIRRRLGNPPWEDINAILEEVDFRYRLIPPDEQTLREDYILRVEDGETDLSINLQDLSSGEKIIFGMTLWLFARRHQDTVPKLLLMDEADAHCHPSLIPVFLDLLEREFVQRSGCFVILATHRPDTIALAPPDSTFLMTRNPTSIIKMDPAEAISSISNMILTVQATTVCVLVESDDDERFYTECFVALNRLGHWKLDYRIEFKDVTRATVGSEHGGGASLVQSKVEVIQTAVKQFKSMVANPFILGLIDREDDNQPSVGVRVIGRHSMENYLYDPLVLYCVLLKREVAPQVPGVEGIHAGDYAAVRSLDCEQKQAIADTIIQIIEDGWDDGVVDSDTPPLDDAEKQRTRIRYTDGTEVSLPLWLIDRRGHDLARVINEVFERRVHKAEMIEKYRELRVVPEDILRTFQSYLS